jgi:hypothetical protein
MRLGNTLSIVFKRYSKTYPLKVLCIFEGFPWKENLIKRLQTSGIPPPI